MSMLALLSPAKTLDFSPLTQGALQPSQPALLDRSRELVLASRKLSVADLMKLMGISKSLAQLNARRFQEFRTPFDENNAKPAIFAFRGDTYVGFDADTLAPAALRFAQAHVRILSGLYGVLRPLDLIQAYRLEMGARLKTPLGKDLYAYWGDSISECINESLPKRGGVVVNLASKEYIKAVRREALQARFIECVFKEVRGGEAKVVGLSAKRARGMMARFMCQEKIGKVEQLREFSTAGYQFQPRASTEDVLEFHRVS